MVKEIQAPLLQKVQELISQFALLTSVTLESRSSEEEAKAVNIFSVAGATVVRRTFQQGHELAMVRREFTKTSAPRYDFGAAGPLSPFWSVRRHRKEWWKW